jgi:Protein of unknown function (DUF3047)
MRTVPCLLLATLLAGCAGAPAVRSAPEADAPVAQATPAAPLPVKTAPAPFSKATAHDVLPAGWRPYRLARFKKPTQYSLVPYNGTVALRAQADASASGLQYDLSVDVHEFPWLSWHWKVPALIPGADNTQQHVEDSPARVIVTFEGGREKLPEAEQINYDLAKAMTGNDLPFATIMYIWENNLPEGTVIDHPMSTRIKFIVAASGSRDVNRWHERRVNVLEDFRRAFGEEPPRIRAVGLMSDSDNTGGQAVAYYGDIQFRKR